VATALRGRDAEPFCGGLTLLPELPGQAYFLRTCRKRSKCPGRYSICQLSSLLISCRRSPQSLRVMVFGPALRQTRAAPAPVRFRSNDPPAAHRLPSCSATARFATTDFRDTVRQRAYAALLPSSVSLRRAVFLRLSRSCNNERGMAFSASLSSGRLVKRLSSVGTSQWPKDRLTRSGFL